MTRHRLLVMLTMGATAGAVACGEVPFDEEPLPGYTLLTEEVWSGGEIVLVSPSFEGLRETVRLVIADDTFPTVYRRADTVVFRADSVPRGTYPIAVLPVVPPALDSPIEVTVRGFEACYPGPAMSGLALPWPRGAREPTFVADGAQSAIIVNARTGAARAAVPESLHTPGYGEGPGFSYDPSSVVLQRSHPTLDDPLESCAWRLAATPDVVECIGAFSSYFIALAAPGKWVDARHHYTFRYWDPDTTMFQLEEPDALALSPRGDFVVLSGASHDGQLVFPVSDEPAFRIPVLASAEAPAAFSPDGDTVYMAGWKEYGHGIAYLVVLDLAQPTDPIATVELGDWEPMDIAVDPVAPFLYIVNGYDFFINAFAITVIDRRTLEHVGQLDIPDGECGEGSWMMRLLISRNEGALYVVQADRNRGPASPSVIYRFDLIAP